jgi:hypothetical protein
MATVLQDKGLAAKLLDRLLAGPLGRQIVAEEAAAKLDARKVAAGELARIERDLERALPGLNAKVDQAAGKLREAEAALQAARRAYQTAERERAGAVYSATRAADRQRSILTELAPASINAFLAEARDADRTALLRARQRVGGYQATVGNGFTKPAYGPLPDDYRRASQQMLDDLAKARADAEALKLVALSDSEIELALASIRAGLFESATTA